MDTSEPKRYEVALHRAKGCFFACVIDLPGCVARGQTEAEALENVRAAIHAHEWIARVLAAEQATLRLEIRA